MMAPLGVVRVVDEVMADVEIKVAIAVEIGEGRRRGPVAIAAEARLAGDVLEPAVTPVAVKCVGTPAGHEQVGPAVIVEVARGHAVAITAREAGDARRSLTSSNVPSPLFRKRWSPS